MNFKKFIEEMRKNFGFLKAEEFILEAIKMRIIRNHIHFWNIQIQPVEWH